MPAQTCRRRQQRMRPRRHQTAPQPHPPAVLRKGPGCPPSLLNTRFTTPSAHKKRTNTECQLKHAAVFCRLQQTGGWLSTCQSWPTRPPFLPSAGRCTGWVGAGRAWHLLQKVRLGGGMSCPEPGSSCPLSAQCSQVLLPPLQPPTHFPPTQSTHTQPLPCGGCCSPG